jgi:hypothetical protein
MATLLAKNPEMASESSIEIFAGTFKASFASHCRE